MTVQPVRQHRVGRIRAAGDLGRHEDRRAELRVRGQLDRARGAHHVGHRLDGVDAEIRPRRVRTAAVDLHDQLRAAALADHDAAVRRLADDGRVRLHGTGNRHGRVPLDHLLRDRGADDHAAALERRRRGAVHERRQRALHVQRAAAVQPPVAQLPGRIGRPRSGIADADRVHVRVEQDARPRPGIERAGHVAERVHRDRRSRAARAQRRRAQRRRPPRPKDSASARVPGQTFPVRHQRASRRPHNACPRHPAGTAMRVREPDHIYRRRRLTALGGLLVLVVIAGRADRERRRRRPAGALGGPRRPAGRCAERAAGRRAQRAPRASRRRVLRRPAEPRAGRARDRQAGRARRAGSPARRSPTAPTSDRRCRRSSCSP